MTRKLKVVAPTRVDLAGGTLDLFPLYVFEGGGLTLNAAVDLFTEVEIESRNDGRFRIESVDLGLEIETGPNAQPDTVGWNGAHPLDLVFRILHYYRPASGLSIRTHCRVPPGSGLGGSSSLLIALSTGLIQIQNRPMNKQEIIDVGANIEAQSLQIPTGKQDYYPAAFGGFTALWFRLDGIEREKLTFSETFDRRLQGQLLLGYSGASRFSGTNNWNMMKGYIDRSRSTVQKMRRIKETAARMYQALKRENLEEFSDCLAEEWLNRRRLAPGVETPAIARIFEAARSAGAAASKICGAGGGGCFITFVNSGRRDAVRHAIEDAGGQILPYRFERTGVRVLD